MLLNRTYPMIPTWKTNLLYPYCNEVLMSQGKHIKRNQTLYRTAHTHTHTHTHTHKQRGNRGRGNVEVGRGEGKR